MDFSIVTCWTNPFVILFLKCRGVRSILLVFILFLMEILLANNVGHDQMPHNMASDMGLSVCL